MPARMIPGDDGGGGGSVATLPLAPNQLIKHSPDATTPIWYNPFPFPHSTEPSVDPTLPAVIKDTKRINASPWKTAAVIAAVVSGAFLLFAILKTRK